RDFGIILACLARRGYKVEWRVANAADFGFPQRRRRVFILAQRLEDNLRVLPLKLEKTLLARALPFGKHLTRVAGFELPTNMDEAAALFVRGEESPFRNAGIYLHGQVLTADVTAKQMSALTLRDVISNTSDVPEHFFLESSEIPKWQKLKDAKKEPRRHQKSGTEYVYAEGRLPFPDPLDAPARTILTGEGGSSPSRFK